MKRSPNQQSMLRRFSGKCGRKNLLSELLRQSIVGGNPDLAEEFANEAELQEFSANIKIIEQGNSDNDLYLIICGKVKVLN